MNDKELYERIVNVNCPFETLRWYLRNKHYVWKSSYDKYYNVNTVLLAIEKYQNGVIDEKYLRRWAQAYYELVKDGFKDTEQKPPLTKEFKGHLDYALYQLCSYFEKDVIPSSIARIKYAITSWDRLLQDIDDCKAVYARKRNGNGYARLLVVNDKAEYFVVLSYVCGRQDEYAEFARVSNRNFNKQIKLLAQQGYAELI